jgi:hypothetical protein
MNYRRTSFVVSGLMALAMGVIGCAAAPDGSSARPAGSNDRPASTGRLPPGPPPAMSSQQTSPNKLALSPEIGAYRDGSGGWVYGWGSGFTPSGDVFFGVYNAGQLVNYVDLPASPYGGFSTQLYACGDESYALGYDWTTATWSNSSGPLGGCIF